MQSNEKALNKQALLEHVKALRKVLVISVVAVLVVFAVLFYLLRVPLTLFVIEPLRQRSIEVVTTRVSEAIMTQLKVCLVAAVIVAMPVIIHQIWGFISPALFPKEKKLFALLFLFALILFLIGVLFSYLFVFPMAIDLFFEAGEGLATSLWSIDQYVDFVLTFVLPFGVMFELPIVVYMLTLKGKLNYKILSANRKYVLLAVAVIAAILTPPDVVSQLMLMLPIMVLYEISVQVARFIKPKPEAIL